MTDNEIILQLSYMLDPIRTDIHEIKGSVKNLENRFTVLEDKVTSLENRFTVLEDKVTSLENRFTVLENKVAGLDGRVSCLENDVKSIKFTQENEILPRLQNIESCYISTYDRYKNSVEEHETMKQDISILKNVVTEHSRQLQKIS